MSEESKKLEVLLFSAGRKMSEQELSKITRLKIDVVKKAIEELRRKYEIDDSPLLLFNEGDSWKLTTKEKYISLVQNVVTETELDRSLMETLAVIAWKYPILQADVIRLRNNKAYEHLKELEEAGFIAREKKGRTRSIRLTPKFFEYFDLPPSKAKAKDAFKDLIPQAIREGVEKTEAEIEGAERKIIEVKKQKGEIEQKMRDNKEKQKEIDLVDDLDKKTKLDVYDSVEEKAEDKKNKLGLMEVYDSKNGGSKISDDVAEQRAEEIEKEPISPEVEAEIDKMIHPGKEKVEAAFGDRENFEDSDKEEVKDDVEEESENLSENDSDIDSETKVKGSSKEKELSKKEFGSDNSVDDEKGEDDSKSAVVEEQELKPVKKRK